MGATAVLSEFASRRHRRHQRRAVAERSGIFWIAPVSDSPRRWNPRGALFLKSFASRAAPPQARVLGSSLRTSAISAAWANGALAICWNYDDNRLFAPDRLHPSRRTCGREEAGATGGRSGGRGSASGSRSSSECR